MTKKERRKKITNNSNNNNSTYNKTIIKNVYFFFVQRWLNVEPKQYYTYHVFERYIDYTFKYTYMNNNTIEKRTNTFSFCTNQKKFVQKAKKQKKNYTKRQHDVFSCVGLCGCRIAAVFVVVAFLHYFAVSNRNQLEHIKTTHMKHFYCVLCALLLLFDETHHTKYGKNEKKKKSTKTIQYIF